MHNLFYEIGLENRSAEPVLSTLASLSVNSDEGLLVDGNEQDSLLTLLYYYLFNKSNVLASIDGIFISVNLCCLWLDSYPLYKFVIGKRRSLPKALTVILMPGAACLRLYSFESTNFITLFTTFSSNPKAIISSMLKSSST